jgi:hypothetical protein
MHNHGLTMNMKMMVTTPPVDPTPWQWLAMRQGAQQLANNTDSSAQHVVQAAAVVAARAAANPVRCAF